MQVPNCSIPVAAAIALMLLPLIATGAVPVVFQDEFVTVRAGIPETGLQPLHIGDPLSLVVDVQFDAQRVQPQQLDSQFFQRAFAELGGIALAGEPTVEQSDGTDDLRRLRATFRFQLLDCPPGKTRCPGVRTYELPVVSLGYQLLDEDGRTLNHKAARFRPWPGRIAIAPAVAAAGDDTELAAWFPGGAWPEAVGTGGSNRLSWFATMAGMALLVAGLGRGRSPARATGFPGVADLPQARWRQALDAMRDRARDDEDRADLLRRALTWYCLDELGLNPCQWLRGESEPGEHAGICTLYLDLLQQERLDTRQCAKYLDRFAALCGAPQAESAA